ncbi:DUF7115 domain-containing protein [Halosolutus gelatinilyticus]|uniref:DUF7115 domain-containing protein n=1 Tax=Halosolutus gelatinilyticus TaxID=2931975 RepID=UPI001FF14A5E|nr:hypothetical protein [Halosolutus gelatinilyticus]
MSVPGIVQSTLDGEEIAARVSLGGEDELFVTPSNTIIYRADGLLSDESVEKYPHDADRITLAEGRRKTKFTLEYALEGAKTFAVPASKTDAVLHPVLAGVLNGNGISDPGETVTKTYRFSELTLIITSNRLVKHIGEAVWDGDYEEYHFDDVTSLAFEDGSVATQIVLTVDGRPQRIKAPNEQANDLRERLKRALFEFHDVESLAELNETVGEDEAEDEDADRGGARVDFGDGVDPLDADPPELDDRDGAGETAANAAADSPTDAIDPLAGDSAIPDSVDASRDRDRERRSADDSRSPQGGERTRESPPVETAELFDDVPIDAEPVGSAAVDVDSAAPVRDSGRSEPAPEVLDRLDALEAAVDRQSELIERQQRTIEQLIEELRQGR